MGAWLAEPRFGWQYAAWMRDPKNGRGNRIQGSLAPAMLDALVDESEDNERYIAQCLSHRLDDVTAFCATSSGSAGQTNRGCTTCDGQGVVAPNFFGPSGSQGLLSLGQVLCGSQVDFAIRAGATKT